ncbi:MAG TPA: hypothetical protein VNG89_01130, partial [Vicinamibacterales bacterium]|nr:hypothetical protein [Vicinamibacterales bacterium]
MRKASSDAATADSPLSSRDDGSPAFALLTLAIALIVSYSRSPALLRSPRFWAEEGSVYYAYATAHGGVATLVAPHLGYFSLVP